MVMEYEVALSFKLYRSVGRRCRFYDVENGSLSDTRQLASDGISSIFEVHVYSKKLD